MNINIKKYALLFILAVASVAVKADYGKIRTIKITLKNGDVYEYYTSRVNSIYFVENNPVTEIQTDLKEALYYVEDPSPYSYQYTNANSVDVFAGYSTVSRSDFQYGPELTHTYHWPNGYYGSACSVGPTEYLYKAYSKAEKMGSPEYKAIAQIVYAYTALRAVNNTGCLPYNDLRDLKVTHPLNYLSQEETYNEILKDLDEAIAILKIVKPSKQSLMAIEGDAYDKGDVDYAYSEYRWEKWVKLANTIKLRIAMYLAKPNEALAKQVAIEALADEIGVLDEDFGPAYKIGSTIHPYYQISAYNDGGWADSRLNASFENILKRTGSPLLDKYFKKNTGAVQDIVTGKKTKAQDNYYGIRQGTSVGKKVIGQGYYNFSDISVAFKYTRQTWVSKEEVLFLKAEYALRWGDDADAKALYYEGIRSALEKYDIGAEYDNYIAQTEIKQQKVAGKTVDIHFVDIYNSNNNIEGRYNLGVKWDSNASKEEQLERLITQKWISIFPNGNVAWADYRRTGYPRLFPSVQKWQGVPSFEKELQLRRIPHNESDDNVAIDLSNIKKALSVFGEAGKNSGGQRLYFEGDPTVYPWTYDEETGWFVPINFVKSSGVEEEENKLSEVSKLKLYPSPMRNELTIEGCIAGDKIMIVDLTGRIYYNAISQSEKEIINVSSYPSGLYIVSIGENVRKVVKID